LPDNSYHKVRTEVPTAPPGCPVDHSFSTFSDSYVSNPYVELEKRRHGEPVFYAEDLGCVAVTKMKDVAFVLKNHHIFSSENVQDPIHPVCKEASDILNDGNFNPIPVMSNCQEPDHKRIRKYTQAGFSGRRIRTLEPYIRERCEALIDAMIAGGSPAELVSSVGYPLPGSTIFRLIGFPESDDDKVKGWSGNRLAFMWGKTNEEEQLEVAQNLLAYWRYCDEFVEMRRGNPADDFTSELLAAQKENPDDLSIHEVKSAVYGLSFAGHEIVTNFLSNALICLFSDRSKWEEICADPSKIENAVEEAVRHSSPQTSWRRIAQADTEIGGVKIPKGTHVFLSLASANHDEEEFPNPTDYDIGRENATRNISFGRGIHFCLGARLAHTEVNIALETLTSKLPSLDLLPDQDLHYTANLTMRGPKELWVTW
jgi:cytochrome P450